MEHIQSAFHGRVTQLPAGPLRVIGATNEILEKHIPEAQGEARATVFADNEVIIQADTAAAQAVIHHQKEILRQAVNELLQARYGGPVVERLLCRRATER